MSEVKRLKGVHRKNLLNELHQRYANPVSVGQRFRYLRKKYLWLLFVEGTRFLKRFIDIVGSVFLFFLFCPIMALIALIIKIGDGGPILYVTNRVGKWGKEFRFSKFRTMKIEADSMKEELILQNVHESDVKFKMKEDPRVTVFGRILRKTSLDELPQLWNVLMGEMSLVGPRPPIPSEVARYSLEDRKRLDVKPGLTCFWQVSGRSDISFERQVEFDLAYIESQSFWLDMKLLLKTIPVVFLGRGAY